MNALEALALGAKHHLSGSALHTLLIIIQDPPMRPTDIANVTGLSSASITGLTDTLVKKGWAERYNSTTDRRSLYITPTERAFEIFNDAIQ